MAVITSLVNLLDNTSSTTISLAILLVIFFLTAAYHLFLDPLRSVPGPLICRLTSLWTYYHSYIGDECTQINRLHVKYGPVVRIAPNEVVIADGAALAPVYSDRGGFPKAPCYQNFDIEGHATIFSTRDAVYRGVRSKAVLPLFSTGNIRANTDAIESCVERFVQRLQREADLSRKALSGKAADSKVSEQSINVLNLCRSLALDAVSSYLFGQAYGGISETGSAQLSASAYVDALVAVGRFFFLPNWLFLFLEETRMRLFVGADEAASTTAVHDSAAPLVEKSTKDDGTYQSRLLNAGISAHETEVQCKDLMFAGTDSTGMNLASILWNLAKHPDVYTTLRAAIEEADANDATQNPQNITYLDAVIREGLRLSMANPTRFPRQVPATYNNGAGFTFTPTNSTLTLNGNASKQSSPSPKSYTFPPGTLIGLAPYTLHLNSNTYAHPKHFLPSRWLSIAEQHSLKLQPPLTSGAPTSEMQRDWIPFGLGPRQCIARNLATAELFLAVRAVVRADCLRGAVAVDGKGPGGAIEIREWFNSRVVGERVDLEWR